MLCSRLLHHFTLVKRSICNVGVKKKIFVSKSRNIYENLALEDWLYQNFDFQSQSLLFLWVNDPCVVIGRHQNPWTEVNLKNLNLSTALLSRRNSGGGTVFHDTGNLNCTFFTSRAHYNRKKNLEFICESIRNEWNLEVKISSREDIFLNIYKVSGTASKIGHMNAYHHCTLMVDVDTTELHRLLCVRDLGIKSKCTTSVRSLTTSLKTFCPGLSINELIRVLAHNFFKESSHKTDEMYYVNPSDKEFPGLGKIQHTLCSWEWIFGKTPEFTLTWPLGNKKCVLTIKVHQGKVVHLDLQNGTENYLRLFKVLLLNQKLDKKLYEEFLIRNNVFSEDNVCSDLEELLISLCITH